MTQAPDTSRCILCGAPAGTPLFSEGTYRVVRCAACRLTWVRNPPPLESEVAWREMVVDLPVPRAALAARLGSLRLPLPPGALPDPCRVLDLALGDAFPLKIANGSKDWLLGPPGAPLRAAAAAAPAARGAEGWERARALAGTWGPVRVLAGPLPDLRLPAGAYDAVLMEDLASHLPDPGAYLREVARLLRPGGILFLRTGNKGELARRGDGERFHDDWEVPAHRFHFSAQALRALLDRSGFLPSGVREEPWIDYLLSDESLAIRSSRSPARTLAKRALARLGPLRALLRGALCAWHYGGLATLPATVRILAVRRSP